MTRVLGNNPSQRYEAIEGLARALRSAAMPAEYRWMGAQEAHVYAELLIDSIAMRRIVSAEVLNDRARAEHIVQLKASDVEALIGFLARPNGSHLPATLEARRRLVVDAVTGGGVLIRTTGYASEFTRWDSRASRLKARWRVFVYRVAAWLAR